MSKPICDDCIANFFLLGNAGAHIILDCWVGGIQTIMRLHFMILPVLVMMHSDPSSFCSTVLTACSRFREHAVNTVEQNDDGSLCIMTSTGRIMKCRRMIVCIPPTQQSKIIWAPAFPSKKKFAMQSSQMGLLIKFLAIYPKPYWKEMGYSGEIVSSGGTPVSPDCEGSPICITLDDSHENQFSIVGFIGGKLAVQWAEKSQKHMEDAILDHLAECFGSWAYENSSLTIKNWS